MDKKQPRKPIIDPDYKLITDEAKCVVFGDRAEAYGHPLPEARLIADLWSAYKGFEFAPEDYPAMMILVKMARERHKHKRDNLVDIAGYAEVLERIHVATEQELAMKEKARQEISTIIETLQRSGARVRLTGFDGEAEPPTSPALRCEDCGSPDVNAWPCVSGDDHFHLLCDRCRAFDIERASCPPEERPN